jgi:hypothetical protein
MCHDEISGDTKKKKTRRKCDDFPHAAVMFTFVSYFPRCSFFCFLFNACARLVDLLALVCCLRYQQW